MNGVTDQSHSKSEDKEQSQLEINSTVHRYNTDVKSVTTAPVKHEKNEMIIGPGLLATIIPKKEQTKDTKENFNQCETQKIGPKEISNRLQGQN